ncbi:hypothetical protein AVV67_gp213 [Escherichia phage vB_EcoM_VR25]|uniref:DUF7320 domain-containing protein n=1 Tax=Escherichia phage vB_EcoM_VR25 TaxID=1567028 RepID=A0A0A7HGF1_9CAUD|nr:hypothetical protein AVV67_gp213 [Escherichia phage vB_EcoM_VR25]AIZ02575.1 hypothetical protein VR25_231 [Escherichia phage vB_EcoM_VR25]
MLSETPITVEEFHEKVKAFAQAMINHVSQRFPDATLKVIQESARSFMIVINPKDGDQFTQLKLGSDGLVEAQRVYIQ